MPKTEIEFSNIQCSDNVVRGSVCVCGGAMELFVLIFHNQRFELGPSISYKIALMCAKHSLIYCHYVHSMHADQGFCRALSG